MGLHLFHFNDFSKPIMYQSNSYFELFLDWKLYLGCFVYQESIDKWIIDLFHLKFLVNWLWFWIFDMLLSCKTHFLLTFANRLHPLHFMEVKITLIVPCTLFEVVVWFIYPSLRARVLSYALYSKHSLPEMLDFHGLKPLMITLW